MIHRRGFLTLASVLLAGWLAEMSTTQASARAVASRKRRIVVIGAGLAGLAAARQLQASGHAVVVVEARARSGGRIWTSTQWPDMPLDLGATWIHGVEGNPLTELAQTIQVRQRMTSYASSLTYGTTGAPLSAAETARLEHLRDLVFQSLQRAQGLDDDRSVRQAVASSIAPIAATPETRRLVNFILSGEIEQEYAGSANRLSAHWYDSAKAFPGEDALFVDGFRVITDELARGLRIELAQVVQAIHWDQSPARVITDKAEFRADQVLVTLPLGVLQAGGVQFTPALPPAKQAAIAKLGMGVLNKCYLRFAEPFWPTDVDWIEYIPARHGAWTEWVSFMQAANLPVLLGFNAADRGREIEAWSDQAIVASAMRTLRTIYGEDIPEPLDHQITRWATDPFALGAYSYNPVGATPDMRKALARPVGGVLFFAGEATEKDYFSTAHGAYLSGLRAAREMLAA